MTDVRTRDATGDLGPVARGSRGGHAARAWSSSWTRRARPSAAARARATLPVPDPQRVVHRRALRTRSAPAEILPVYYFATGSDRVPHDERCRPGDERLLRAPGCAHRRRREGHGRHPPMPLPRVVLRRRERPLLGHPVRLGFGAHPEQGGDPRLSHPRAQRHDVGVAPPRGEAPFYDVPEVPELSDPEWSEPYTAEYVVRTGCQEMAENNHDAGPLPIRPRHRRHSPNRRSSSTAATSGSSGMDGHFIRETFGLGPGRPAHDRRHDVLHVDHADRRGEVHVRWIFIAPKSERPGCGQERSPSRSSAA